MDIQQVAVKAISAIDSVPRMLEVVCKTTGMGFAAVARVTDTHWICCASQDDIGFGLGPGGELPLQTTICNEIRQSHTAVIIDHVAEDASFCDHPTPALYGFQSYISVPIVRADGQFWGTLCAIDPKPAKVSAMEVKNTFKLFADLIAFHLDNVERVEASEAALSLVRQQSLLREQFVAVLGHDLRSPLQAVITGLHVLERAPERTVSLLPTLKRSTRRMAELVGNVMDFARARLGRGISVTLRCEETLEEAIRQVIDEGRAGHPDRVIHLREKMIMPVWCDAPRIAQLASNLVANALQHGSPGTPVEVSIVADDGVFELQVVNSGSPIPEEARGKLFEPYERGGEGSSKEGLGLGLYIVSEIARAHGGRVEVESGQGATSFTLRMPLDGRTA